jgi:putative transposase
VDNVGTTLAVAPGAEWVIPQPEAVNLHPTLGDVMGAFKSLVFTVYLDWIEAHDPVRRAKFWQRNYYEHVIRHDAELAAIRRYIQDNPLHWAEDRDNLENVRRLPVPAKVEDYLEDVQILMQE